jgi:hypothetical protein
MLPRREFLQTCLLTAVALLSTAMALAQDSGLTPTLPNRGTSAWPPTDLPYTGISATPAETSALPSTSPLSAAPLATSPANGPIELGQLIAAENPHNSQWYARWDYFTWNERLDGQQFVRESGSLTTIGYQRRMGVERFRAELFGGTVDYRGAALFDDGSTEPLNSYTSYLGGRAEFDLLWEPEGLPSLGFFAGAGTRFWARDLKDGFTASGSEVWGYQEVWWTIYPFVGLEFKQPINPTLHFFGSMRAGLTAVTYEQVAAMDVALYPKCGATGQLECGLRGAHFTFSAYLEMMDWNQSAATRDILQPYSRMFITGLKAGWAF